MINSNVHSENLFGEVLSKSKDVAQLAKMRLSLLVVFSSLMGYLYACAFDVAVLPMLGLVLGGFFVTAASNTFNQLYERRTDALMKRTEDRPIAAGRMTTSEGVFWAMSFAVSGIFLLNEMTNELTALFATFSLILYAFLYTPLKRLSRLSVYVGAVPGAMPFLLGWVAFNGTFTFEAGLLFLIQFLWQLPHTWSIAWLLKGDYSKVGIKMMPTNWKNPTTDASVTLLTSVLLLIACMLPVYYGFVGLFGAFAALLFGLYFCYRSLGLLIKQDMSAAKSVLMASILFLPLMQIGFVIDKMIP